MVIKGVKTNMELHIKDEEIFNELTLTDRLTVLYLLKDGHSLPYALYKYQEY